MAKILRQHFQRLVDRKDTAPTIKALGADALLVCWEVSNIKNAKPKEEIFALGVKAGIELAMSQGKQGESKC